MTTNAPCPAWCTTHHEFDGEDHRGLDLGPGWPGISEVRIYLASSPDAVGGVMVGEHFVSVAAAHELGLALVRAADVLRRERQAADTQVPA